MVTWRCQGAASAAKRGKSPTPITYSLTEAKQTGLDAESETASRLAGETRDAYLLSLAVNTLLNAGRSQAGRDAAKRLIDLQGGGRWLCEG